MKPFAQCLIFILILVPISADAQLAESVVESVVESVLKPESHQFAAYVASWEMQSKTPLGNGERHRIVYTSNADTMVVWTNLRGEPRIVRAQIGGKGFARTLTAGSFPLSDSLLQAYEWMQDETFRKRLEALLDDEAVTVRNQ